MLAYFADTLFAVQEAVEETAGHESDKTLFYVLGSVAAAWALLLFAVGMRAASFPGSVPAQRAVMLISAVLVVATMASAVITA